MGMVAVVEKSIPSEQQESLLPCLNPLLSRLAMEKALGSSLGSLP